MANRRRLRAIRLLRVVEKSRAQRLSACSLGRHAGMFARMAPLLRLYPFKFRDPISRTWIKARYKATLDDIAARYTEWMIAGEPEVRGNIPSSSFNPYRWTDGAVTHPGGPDVELLPALRGAKLEFDSLEAFLVGVFLRRYVTYCARQRRFAAMQGAADLLRRVKTE